MTLTVILAVSLLAPGMFVGDERLSVHTDHVVRVDTGGKCQQHDPGDQGDKQFIHFQTSFDLSLAIYWLFAAEPRLNGFPLDFNKKGGTGPPFLSRTDDILFALPACKV